MLWMIVSNGQMLTGHDLDSGSLITYFCKKKVLTVLWFTCNVWMLICVNYVLVLPLTCPPVSTWEQFWAFKQIVLSFMLYPSHTTPLSITAQILHSNLIECKIVFQVFCIFFPKTKRRTGTGIWKLCRWNSFCFSH